MNKLTEFIAKVGMDKIAHFGVGGLLTAMITFVVILQDFGSLSMGMIIASPIIGTIVTMFLEFIKEKFFDDEFNKKDVVATLIGCAMVFLSVIIGAIFNVLS